MRISDWSSDVCSSDLFSARLLEPIEQDLVIVAGSIAYSDRIARRHRSAGWAREISLSIPVSQPDFWKQKKIASTLSEAVEYVSGDCWNFEFVLGSQGTLVKNQSSLDFTRGNYVVLPFSDGMDSFLQWQLLKKCEPQANILRVHTHSRVKSEEHTYEIQSLM